MAGAGRGRATQIAGIAVGGLLVVAAFTLGTTKIEDPDAWTHLALGRELVHQGALPTHEPFTFASAGRPFHDTEWLFQVLFYLSYAVGGFVGVILLKGALSALLLLILWKDSGLSSSGKESDRIAALMIRAAVLLVVLLMIRPRLVERPDLMLMIFLSFTTYALNAYFYQGRRHLYWVPVLLVLWANMHPSVVLGMVPFVAFLGGGLTLWLLSRWRGLEISGSPTPTHLKTVAGVGVVALGASLINPYGLEALTLPFRFAMSMRHFHPIVELQPPDLIQHPWPFLMTALLAVTLIALGRRLPVSAILLVGPFVILGLSARRFGYLLAIVAAPVLAKSFVALAQQSDHGAGRHVIRALSAGGVLSAVAATVLALLNAGSFADARRLPGFGMNDLFLPERALKYLDSVGIEGRIFNTFHWGGYINWRDFPRRFPIIDGRANVEMGLLWDIRHAHQDIAMLDQLQTRYGLDVAVVAYPAAPHAFVPPRWALVYWDDVALVYVRRSPRLAALIARDEYRHVDPAGGVDRLLTALSAGNASAIETELRRNIDQTGSSIGHLLLGFARLQARAYDEAIGAFRQVRGYSTIVDAAQGLAMAYWQKGDIVTAADHYERVVEAYPTAVMLYNLGLARAHMGKDRDAVADLERARRRDPHFAPVYPALMSAYRRLGREDRAQDLAPAHAAALNRARAQEHFRKARQLTQEGKLDDAAAAFEDSLRLNPDNPPALSLLGDVYLQQGRLDDAIDRQQVALQIDPELAQAHYGLARVYELRGEHASASRHFNRFLRLEPASYRAWTVRKALNQPPLNGRRSPD